MEAVRTLIIEEHNKLIQQLEDKYLNYLKILLKQKALIHQHIQKSLYQQLFKLNDIANKYKNNNINNINNGSITNINSLSLPLSTLEHDNNNNHNNNNQDISIWNCVICEKECGNKKEYAFHIKYHSAKDVQKSEMIITQQIHQENENNNKREAEQFKLSGNKLLKNKQFERAIIAYTKAIHLDASNPIYLSNRAAAYTDLKKYQQATVDAHKASDIDPNYVKAYMREGVAEHKMQHYEKAHSAFSKAISKLTRNDKNAKTFKQIQARINLCKQEMDKRKKNNPAIGTRLRLKLAIVGRKSLETNTLPYQCEKCGKLFKQQQNLKKHMIQHTGSKQFVCGQCQKPFKYKNDLKTHLKNVHSLNKINATPIKSENITIGRPFRCSECSMRFKKAYRLKSHMICHSDERPFKCSECSQAFKRKVGLKQHIICHSNEKPFKCNKCDHTFKRRGGLKKHMMHIHSKQFKCNECDDVFNRSIDLDKHIRKHFGDGPGPYGCNQCHETFAKKNELNTHILQHKNIEHKCNKCARTFQQSNDLKQHMKMHKNSLAGLFLH